jgi:hypothetical protein
MKLTYDTETANQVIWKYELAPLTQLHLPHGAQVLDVGSQDIEVVMWVAVDPHAEMDTRLFRVVPTGRPFDPAEVRSYVGSTQMANGLVFHVLELRCPALPEVTHG